MFCQAVSRPSLSHDCNALVGVASVQVVAQVVTQVAARQAVSPPKA